MTLEREEFIIIDTTSDQFPVELRDMLREEFYNLCLIDHDYVHYFSEWVEDRKFMFDPVKCEEEHLADVKSGEFKGTFEEYMDEYGYVIDRLMYDFLLSQGWDGEPVGVLLR